MDCAGGTLISTKKLKIVLSKLKYGKGSPDQITADVLKELPSDCLEKPGGMDLFLDSSGTKSCGCNEPGQIQADRWIARDEKSVRLRLAQFTPSAAVREWFRLGLCRRYTRMLGGLFLLLKAAELSR